MCTRDWRPFYQQQPSTTLSTSTCDLGPCWTLNPAWSPASSPIAGQNPRSAGVHVSTYIIAHPISWQWKAVGTSAPRLAAQISWIWAASFIIGAYLLKCLAPNLDDLISPGPAGKVLPQQRPGAARRVVDVVVAVVCSIIPVIPLCLRLPPTPGSKCTYRGNDRGGRGIP
jgi:hypothetical protein